MSNGEFDKKDDSGAAQPVAERDAAEASGGACSDGGQERELAVVDRNTRQHKNGLVRNERANNAQHEQSKDGEVAVICQEVVDVFHAFPGYSSSARMAASAVAGFGARET